MSTPATNIPAPPEPSGPVTASVHTGGSPSTTTVDSDSITFRMGKQSLGILIASLLAASGAGGGIVSGLSDKKLDERVGAALSETLDRKLSGKFAEMQAASTAAATTAAREAAEPTSKQVAELKEILIKQGAAADASAKVDGQQRATTTQLLADHEERLRFLERQLSGGRR